MKIAIIGPGAVGKTTIIEILKKDLIDFKFMDEREEILNENFDSYMKDFKSNAFESQKHFFNFRKKQIESFINFDNVIIDRHLIDDFIFPETHIEFKNFNSEEATKWKKIEEEYLLFLKSIPKLDFLFLLTANDEIIKKRREKRSLKEDLRKSEMDNHYFFNKVNEKYQSDNFKKFAEKFTKKLIILENKESEKTAKNIKEIILKRLT